MISRLRVFAGGAYAGTMFDVLVYHAAKGEWLGVATGACLVMAGIAVAFGERLTS